MTSLPPKTALLGLDNAFIEFDNFEVPHAALLNRFSSVSLEVHEYICIYGSSPESTPINNIIIFLYVCIYQGEYSLSLPPGVTRMLDLLITRLLTGRISLSEYTIATALNITRHSWKQACSRVLWKGKREKEERRMSDLPIVRATFINYSRALHVVGAFLERTRHKVAECIRNDKFHPKGTTLCLHVDV